MEKKNAKPHLISCFISSTEMVTLWMCVRNGYGFCIFFSISSQSIIAWVFCCKLTQWCEIRSGECEKKRLIKTSGCLVWSAAKMLPHCSALCMLMRGAMWWFLFLSASPPGFDQSSRVDRATWSRTVRTGRTLVRKTRWMKSMPLKHQSKLSTGNKRLIIGRAFTLSDVSFVQWRHQGLELCNGMTPSPPPRPDTGRL